MAVTTPYYLRHRTPQGDRYAAPHPAHRASDVGFQAEWHGETTDAETGEVRVVAVEIVERATSYGLHSSATPPWVISTAPLSALVATWTRPGKALPWRKRPEQPGGVVASLMWERMPDEPTEHVLGHLNRDACSACADHEDCADGDAARAVYYRPPAERVPDSRRYDLTHLVEFEATLDPDPSRAWVLTDASALAVYGETVAHTLPGGIPGLRAAVVEALRAHPFLSGGKVYDHDRNGNVSVFYDVRWDVPIKRKRHEGERGRGPFYSHKAMPVHVEHIVPEHVTGASKADALGRWGETVQAWVDTFVPDVDGITACSSCRGKGYHLPAEQS